MKTKFRLIALVITIPYYILYFFIEKLGFFSTQPISKRERERVREKMPRHENKNKACD